MLADFQPRCIMIFMVMSSENPVSAPYCRAPCAVRNIPCLSATAAVLVAPPAIEKERVGFEQLNFLYPVHSETLNMTDGGPTSLGAGAKGTHGKQDQGDATGR
jgi:hypothetical protein